MKSYQDFTLRLRPPSKGESGSPNAWSGAQEQASGFAGGLLRLERQGVNQSRDDPHGGPTSFRASKPKPKGIDRSFTFVAIVS